VVDVDLQVLWRCEPLFPAPKVKRKTKGRPAKKGRALAKPQTVIWRVQGTKLKVRWYSGGTRQVQVVTGTGNWQGKLKLTFSDMISSVRSSLWLKLKFEQVPGEAHFRKLSPTIKKVIDPSLTQAA
jgi:hypothetical protein